MDIEEINLCNTCTDLVSLKKLEAFPLHLVASQVAGVWIGVLNLCAKLGLSIGDVPAGLFVTWLPDPADELYAVIIFYDDESKSSMTAHYNRMRFPDTYTTD